jgi:hypothetical protein
MWAQERYSLFPSEWRKKNSALEKSVTFGTIRGIRSAAAHFWIWDLLHTHSNKLTLGFRDRPTIVNGCSPTDKVAYTYFTDGLKRRMGDNPKPSTVLLLEHMIWLDRYYDSVFTQATDPLVQISICIWRANSSTCTVFLCNDAPNSVRMDELLLLLAQ